MRSAVRRLAGVLALGFVAATSTVALTAPAASAQVTAPCGPQAEACVNLATKQAWLMENGVVTYGPVPVNTGKSGYRTPTGNFTVQWKDIDHLSREFNNAPMPYSTFFTSNGIAFHQGNIAYESHGCIRMRMADAQAFFAALQVGEDVQVVSVAEPAPAPAPPPPPAPAPPVVDNPGPDFDPGGPVTDNSTPEILRGLMFD